MLKFITNNHKTQTGKNGWVWRSKKQETSATGLYNQRQLFATYLLMIHPSKLRIQIWRQGRHS